jgi:hypothetical protein
MGQGGKVEMSCAHAARERGKVGGPYSLHVDQINILATVAIGEERDLLAVLGPRSEVVLFRVAGEVALFWSVGVHDVDFVIAVAI